MAANKKLDSSSTRSKAKVDEVELLPAGEAIVETFDNPPVPSPDKAIHPRRPLPTIPDSKGD